LKFQKERQMHRQEKLNLLIGLLTGKISKDDMDIKTFTTKIGFGIENIYLINNKQVNKEVFDLQSSTQPITRLSVSFLD
jgi:hypothetical protein